MHAARTHARTCTGLGGEGKVKLAFPVPFARRAVTITVNSAEATRIFLHLDSAGNAVAGTLVGSNRRCVRMHNRIHIQILRIAWLPCHAGKG